MFKYIIFQDSPEQIPELFIFDGFKNHSDVARKIDKKIYSAGKISKAGNCICGSVTLNISYSAKQTADDQKIIDSLANVSF